MCEKTEIVALQEKESKIILSQFGADYHSLDGLGCLLFHDQPALPVGYEDVPLEIPVPLLAWVLLECVGFV